MGINYSELFGGFPTSEVRKKRAETVIKKKEELKGVYEKYRKDMEEIQDLMDDQTELGKTHLYTAPVHDDVKWMLKLLGYKVTTETIISGDFKSLITWG